MAADVCSVSHPQWFLAALLIALTAPGHYAKEREPSVYLNRIKTRVSLLISALAVACVAIGLGPSSSYGGNSNTRAHTSHVGGSARRHESRRNSGCATAAARRDRQARGHGHATSAKRCPKGLHQHRAGVSETHKGSPQGAPSSAGSTPAQPEAEASAELSAFTQLEPAASSGGPFRFFSPTSFWNEQVPANATLAPNSSGMVTAFSAEITRDLQLKLPPWINTTSSSIPIYTAPASQPTVKVALENGAKSPALQAAWDAVPLPANAQPSAGSDKALVVWQPSTDELWDFWRLAHTSQGWQASWGGAMQDVSSNPGVYGPEAWPGASRRWGDSASSLEPLGGLLFLEDFKLGQINHALRMAIPEVRTGVYASPAQRTDGKSTNPLSLPEGAHLRLDPTLNLAALHLPPVTLMLAEAAQRYGIFVTDYAPNVTFYAQDPLPTGTNPYAGPTGYFEGKSPRELLASFPWSHLQVLNLTLHSTS